MSPRSASSDHSRQSQQRRGRKDAGSRRRQRQKPSENKKRISVSDEMRTHRASKMGRSAWSARRLGAMRPWQSGGSPCRWPGVPRGSRPADWPGTRESAVEVEPLAAKTRSSQQPATPEAEAKRKQEEDQHQRREANAPRKQDEAKRLERRTAWCDEAVAVRRKPLPLARRSSGGHAPQAGRADLMIRRTIRL